jgi:hypothetical protein
MTPNPFQFLMVDAFFSDVFYREYTYFYIKRMNNFCSTTPETMEYKLLSPLKQFTFTATSRSAAMPSTLENFQLKLL